MRLIFSFVLAAFLVASVGQCDAMISVGELSKEEAGKLGITMKHRKNGDAGEMVWLEFKKEGFLEAFNDVELRISDAKKKSMVSAMLRQCPVVHGQPDDLLSCSFAQSIESLEPNARRIANGESKGKLGEYDTYGSVVLDDKIRAEFINEVVASTSIPSTPKMGFCWSPRHAIVIVKEGTPDFAIYICYECDGMKLKFKGEGVHFLPPRNLKREMNEIFDHNGIERSSKR
jgi:hypothetical protein